MVHDSAYKQWGRKMVVQLYNGLTGGIGSDYAASSRSLGPMIAQLRRWRYHRDFAPRSLLRLPPGHLTKHRYPVTRQRAGSATAGSDATAINISEDFETNNAVLLPITSVILFGGDCHRDNVLTSFCAITSSISHARLWGKGFRPHAGSDWHLHQAFAVPVISGIPIISTWRLPGKCKGWRLHWVPSCSTARLSRRV